jgi:hypothetical protein
LNGTIDEEILLGFFRGLMAAEGYAGLNKHGSVVRAGIAFDPHSNEKKLYSKILELLLIKIHMIKGNMLLIQKFENFKNMHELDAFKYHQKRKKKFITGLKSHKFSKDLLF